MNRVSLFASLIALSLGTVSVFHVQRQPNFLSTNENVSHITDGAFRDGLYLGRLAAENGVAPHVVSGRWATGAIERLSPQATKRDTRTFSQTKLHTKASARVLPDFSCAIICALRRQRLQKSFGDRQFSHYNNRAWNQTSHVH